MDKDIVPELLEQIKKKFETLCHSSDILENAFKHLKSKKATYETVNELAIEVGDILSKVLGGSISAEKLPDGKMYYNIAKRLLDDTLGRNFDIVSGYARDVQQVLNKKAGIGLKAQIPALNQDKIDGLVNRLSNSDDFESVSWLLGDPIVTFTQGIVDDAIRENVEFHAKAGLSPKIIRTHTGNCCDWCRNLAGIYDYPKVPKDVYRRHGNCRCTVDYKPGDGKKQNVWSKGWRKKDKSDRSVVQISNEVYNKNTKSSQKIANSILNKVLNIEKSITKDMRILSNRNGGYLAGLDFRIKSFDSLVRKIETDSLLNDISLSEAGKSINDALRYTTIFDKDTFSSDYLSMKDNLIAKGYKIVKVKNTWLDDVPYKGVNTVLSKGNLNFEMQYHTEESFELKNGRLHTLYEERRLPSTSRKRKLELDEQMLDLSRGLEIPIDIERVR
ncbi:hypothetical protein KG091_07810 [Carnobacteriaceae bacterium zg-ZUI78]|nr:hypothetical protein [Carnobacteriaceae bacterium zg-ZUI78]